MSRSRWVLVPVVLVASMAMSAAVFGSSKPKAKSSQSSTLTVLSAASLDKALANMERGFEKANPGVTIKATVAPQPAVLDTILATQINSGNPPDLVITTPGTAGLSGVWPLAKARRIVDLSKEPWVKNLPKKLREAGEYKGKMYALPLSSYFFGLPYSTKIFAQAGVKPPTTMNEMLKACRTIRSKTGVTPVATGAADGPQGIVAMWGLAAQYVYAKHPNWNALRDKKKVKFATSKEWKAVWGALDRMKAANCFSPGAAGATTANARADFRTGKAAMFWYVSITLAQEQAAMPNDTVKFFVLPGEKAKDRVAPTNSSAISVSSKNNVALAKKFMAYLAAPANNNGYNKIAGAISYTNLKKGTLPAGNEAVAQLAKKKLASAYYTTWANSQLAYYMAKGMQQRLTGQKSTAEILRGMDYMWDNPTATAPPGG